MAIKKRDINEIEFEVENWEFEVKHVIPLIKKQYHEKIIKKYLKVKSLYNVKKLWAELLHQS